MLRGNLSALKRHARDMRFRIANVVGRPALYNLKSRERIGAIYREPSDMCVPDRLMLYALARGLRPDCALEIGVRWGNSGRIVANAMEDNGHGRIFGLDPEPSAYRQASSDMHGRYTLIEGFSPQDVAKVASAAGAPFDFVLIDALHTHDAVLRDYDAVVPYLAKSAHVVFHDAYHQGIDRAVSRIVAEDGDITDFGILTRHPAVGDPVQMQGLRVIARRRVEGPDLIVAAAERAGLPPPVFDACLDNYADWANRNGLGATEAEISRWKVLRAARDGSH